MTRLRPFLIALALTAGATGLAGCHKAQPPSDQQTPRTVSVVHARARQLNGVLSATGPLVPREQAAVIPEVTGYRVAKVLVDVGSKVHQGQTLVQLDDALLRSQVDEQAARAAQADAQAQQAEAEAARVKGLDNQGVLSQEAIDQRRFAAKAARATANAEAASLRDLRTRQAKLSVASPVDGLVLTRNVGPGDLSSAASATPWFTIARDSQIELEAQLSEADLARVHVGDKVAVRLTSGETVQGVVRLVSPAVDPQTRLGPVRVALPLRQDIRSGGFADGAFGAGSKPVNTLPETAIRYDADGSSVMVVGSDNKVAQVKVKLGARGGGLVEILSGAPEGTRVLERAASLVLPGDVVRPVEANDAAPAAPAKATAAK